DRVLWRRSLFGFWCSDGKPVSDKRSGNGSGLRVQHWSRHQRDRSVYDREDGGSVWIHIRVLSDSGILFPDFCFTVFRSRSKALHGVKMKKVPYEVIRVGSWDEYLDLIGDSPYQNWAFRGQRDATMPLFSALSRYLIAYR